MKNLIVAVVLTAVAFTACKNTVNPDKIAINSTADSISYLIGYDYGEGMANDMGSVPGKPMNNNAIAIGYLNGIFGEDSLVTVESTNEAYLNEYFNTLRSIANDTVAVDTVKPEGGKVIKGYEFTATIATDADTASYLLGFEFGKNFAKGFKDTPGEPLSNDIIAAGFIYGIRGEEARVTVEDRRRFITEYFNNAHKKDQQVYLDENAEKDSVNVTESGLQYKILVEGTGVVPQPEDQVKVHYHGTLVNGNVFDSSVNRGEPVVFGCTQVIPGWTEALTMMPVGSKWELTIPENLAYGAQAMGSIPAYSTLIFTVELLEIVDTEKANSEE